MALSTRHGSRRRTSVVDSLLAHGGKTASFNKILRGVLARPAFWAVAAAGTVGAVLAPTLAGDVVMVGVAAWGEWAVVRAVRRDPGGIRVLLGRVREDAAHVDAVTRARVDGILCAYDAICRDAASKTVPRYARGPLAATVTHLEGLARRAALLATRRAELAQLLEGVHLSALRGRRASLQARSVRSAHDDPVLHQQLVQALRFKGEETKAYEAIEQTVRRIDGELESLECAFAAVKARLCRLKSGHGSTDWALAGEQMEREVAAVTIPMDSLDDALVEVLALRRSSNSGA